MTMLEKTGVYASIFFILLLLLLIAFSKNGVVDYKSLKGKETVLLDQMQTIELKNENLENEINSLKTDMDYIKHVAKHEYDMAEEDEIIFKDNSGKRNKK
jgi:cell division protein FtsB